MNIVKVVRSYWARPEFLWRVVLVLALGFVCGGCASSGRRPNDAPFAFAKYLYDTEAYYRCLDQIETQLKRQPVPTERALLLLLKGMCQEELKLYEAANETYRLIMKEFAHTIAADEAELRLNRKFGDQREHLTINVTNLGWRRIETRANALMSEEKFCSEKESPQKAQTLLILQSMDYPEKIVVLDQFLEKLKANSMLVSTDVSWQVLQKTEQEAELEVSYTATKINLRIHSLVRVIWGHRVHLAEIRTRKLELTETERQFYQNQLRTALVEGSE